MKVKVKLLKPFKAGEWTKRLQEGGFPSEAHTPSQFVRGGEGLLSWSDVDDLRLSGADIEISDVDYEEPDFEPVEIDATTAATKLAGEWGIDLELVEGTGEDGRILVGDVKEIVNMIIEDQVDPE